MPTKKIKVNFQKRPTRSNAAHNLRCKTKKRGNQACRDIYILAIIFFLWYCPVLERGTIQMVQLKQNDAINRTENNKSSVGANALAEDVCYVEVE